MRDGGEIFSLVVEHFHRAFFVATYHLHLTVRQHAQGRVLACGSHFVGGRVEAESFRVEDFRGLNAFCISRYATNNQRFAVFQKRSAMTGANRIQTRFQKSKSL